MRIKNKTVIGRNSYVKNENAREVRAMRELWRVIFDAADEIKDDRIEVRNRRDDTRHLSRGFAMCAICGDRLPDSW